MEIVYKGNAHQEHLEQAEEIKTDMKKTELKAQGVEDKEEQLITRKRTAKLFLADVVKKVKDGFITPEFATLQLKQLTKDFNSTLTEIEQLTLESLVGTDYYVWGDYKITRREGSKTVDYSDCEEIQAMEKHLKQLKTKYKAALEGATNGITVTLEDHCFADADGTILKLPKWKYNKSSIVLTKV